MRLIMMGTGPFGKPTLEMLIREGHDTPLLVTRPTAELKTRGKSVMASTPMADVAKAHGIPVIEVADVNAPEAHAQLLALKADLFVVCDFGQILSAATLSIPRLGGINLHGSLLPKYRGASPVAWAILAGDQLTGVSVIHMTPRLDAGPILSTKETPILPEETCPELEARLSELGCEAVRDALRQLKQWDGESPIGTRQDKSLATKAPRLAKSDGEVDWSKPAEVIHRQVRALKPWPGAFTHLEIGESKPPLRLILEKVALPQEGVLDQATEAGRIVQIRGDRFMVATGKGQVEILEVQPAGKRRMSASEFVRGYRIQPGAKLIRLAPSA